ncbi:serine/threonine-protein phosphatase 2A activator [Drosophila kikkawai]|uniref:Serine/threonine-protein phosphatase 2A activator n=1 Tax=Drosophila kikkawai TaxID=30033 RepID=A0A6P4JS30_DROKI|nr:serine/threonine-protein phosphatase 2A activator [Drosophila kikkawai]
MEEKRDEEARQAAKFFIISNTEVACRIQSTLDIDVWRSSEAFYNLISYLNDVSTEVQGVLSSASFPVSENIRRLTTIFDKLDEIVTSSPPAFQVVDTMASASLDLGNKGYRRFSRIMLRDIYQILEEALPVNKCSYVNELGQYLSGAFGSSTKIEYGTGHELSFLFFMCGLFEAKILRREQDLAASALILFDRYLKFVRRMQVLYSVVSANCQGAYGLDKFQFVPYIWGAAQLCHGAPFSPQKMLDENIVEEYKTEYMLIDCVRHVYDTAGGSFARHSSQLWSLAALSSWMKIHRGLMFMYMEDILLDFDSLSALRFGELMPFEKAKSGRQLGNARLGAISPVRCQLRTSRLGTPMNSKLKLSPRKDNVYSDALSNSGLSLGSECSSLSGVSVNLPTWMEEDSPNTK